MYYLIIIPTIVADITETKSPPNKAGNPRRVIIYFLFGASTVKHLNKLPIEPILANKQSKKVDKTIDF